MIRWLKRTAHEFAIWTGIARAPDFRASFVESNPLGESVPPGIVYIVGGPGYQKWAVFRCPGHESEIIHLSLMQKRSPHWSVRVDHFGRPTIQPSVRQTAGSFAHFWIRGGMVEWCADSGRPSSFT
jgi:hypothetical protein